MKVVDANVLIYATNRSTPQHEASIGWLDHALGGNEDVGLTWNALLAFIRISTSPRIMPHPLSTEEALAQVHDWLAAPSAHVLQPGERHAMILEGLLATAGGTAGNLVNDAHLAALAIEHRAEIVSFDTDFARFEGVKSKQPDARRPRASESTME